MIAGLKTARVGDAVAIEAGAAGAAGPHDASRLTTPTSDACATCDGLTLTVRLPKDEFCLQAQDFRKDRLLFISQGAAVLALGREFCLQLSKAHCQLAFIEALQRIM